MCFSTLNQAKLTFESWAGIEPAHCGFADRRVTTSPPGRIHELLYHNVARATCSKARQCAGGFFHLYQFQNQYAGCDASLLLI